MDAPRITYDPPGEVGREHHFAELLSALTEATHPTPGTGDAFTDAFRSLALLVEVDSSSRLAGESETGGVERNPLCDSGVRRLVAGLVDIATYSGRDGNEYRELRELLQSFDSIDEPTTSTSGYPFERGENSERV